MNAYDESMAPIPLVTRTTRRLEHQEHKRQINIESVLLEAGAILREVPDEEVSDEAMDEDWIAHFFQYSKDVSNDELRSIWAPLACQ